jgi:murein L,D-transpeptidase YcbB/YkuD
MTTSLRYLMTTAAMVATWCVAAPGSAAAGTPTRDVQIRQDGLHIVLNVAGNWLYVYEDGERTRTYTVSVGLPGYETPPGEYRIGHINWNPWWHPPNSAWARGRTPERPGSPTNPMGRVKIHFAPLLYIHGTPESEALGFPASRGCVRMRNEDAMELARLIHSHASPSVAASTLDQLQASPRMDRTIRLARPVHFTAVYEVAYIEDGFLVIHPDIYGRLERELRHQVEHTLERSGVDLARVNRDHLARLVEKGTNRRVVIAMEELVAGWRADEEGEGYSP